MIFVLWGEDKSCKNTLALSFPRPLVDMEFDIGGFNRSCRNLPHLSIKDWYDKGEIRLQQFTVPFQIQLDSAMNVRASKLVVGMKELFYQFAAKFIGHLNDPNLKTIMVDTGTLLYEVTSQGFLQEKQEAQPPGEKLMIQLYPPVLYRDVNIRMRGFLYQAKAHGKHLVLTHHAADEYGLVTGSGGTLVNDKTGKRVLHGWGQLGDSADVVVHTWWDKKDNAPYCEVELAEVKELEGMKFREPTFDKIQAAIRMIRGE